MYPSEVELALRRFERKCVAFFVRHEKIAFLPVLALAFALAYWTKIHIDDLIGHEAELLMNGQFATVRVGRFSFMLLIGLALLSYFVEPRFRRGFNAAVTIVAWICNCYVLFYNRLPAEIFALILFGVPVVIFSGFWVLGQTARPEQCRRMMIGFTIFCAALYAATIYLMYEGRLESAMHAFLRLKMHYVLFVTWTLYLSSKYMQVDRHVLLSPVNITKAVLWPPDTRLETESRQESKAIWWQGMLNILVGYTLLQARFVWNDVYYMLEKNSMARGFVGFTLAVLVDVAIFNIIVGLARLFAFRARDATNFVWLARSPAEYWRRGSVYHYEFVQRHVFVPLLRFTRRRLLVMFGAFFIFYLMKNGVVTTFSLIFTRLRLMTPPEFLEVRPQRFLLMHFLFQFGLLMVSQRWWPGSGRQGGPWLSWFLVALTLFLNSFIIFFAHQILVYIRTLG